MLLLYMDGHGAPFDGGVGGDSIKKYRPELPKGYRYIDQRPEEDRPEESTKEENKSNRPEESPLPKIKIKPVALEDVQKLAKIFQGELYPVSIYSIVDAIEAGVKASKLELEAAIKEALLYQQIAEAQREKELLNQVHRWLLEEIRGVAWTDEEIFTVLLLAKKNKDYSL